MPDIDELAEQDKQKAKRAFENYRQSDGLRGAIPGPAAIIEKTMWALCILSVIGMVVVLPWVGTDKMIRGTAWLAVGSICIISFAVFGYMFRWIRDTESTQEYGQSQGTFKRGR